MTHPIAYLKGVHSGQPCNIVGLGMSIHKITEAHFVDGPIIAMNDAPIKLRELKLNRQVYSLQKDGGDKGKCGAPCQWICGPTRKPEGEILLIHEHESKHCWSDYKPRYIFDNPKDFGYAWNMPSFCVAVSMAELFGCSELNIISCDRLANGSPGRAVFIESNPPIPTSIMYDTRCWKLVLSRSPIKKVRFVTPQ